MKYFIFLFCGLILLSIPNQAFGDPAVLSKRSSLLIVSVDGLRPDVLLRANMPAVRQRMSEGSFTFYARTTDLAKTLPSHTSMLTGVPVAKHGVVWNDERSVSNSKFPLVPTLFQIAKQKGYSTALVAGKSKFALLAKSAFLDWEVIRPTKVADSDEIIALQAIKLIHEHLPQLLFVHLPHVDTVGHANGWGSDAQIEAAANADGAIQKIIHEFSTSLGKEKLFTIITTDHGGEQEDHGPNSIASRYIPIVITGPGIRKNFDLTLSKSEIAIEDIFATSCRLLGLTIPDGIDGRVIEGAFE